MRSLMPRVPQGRVTLGGKLSQGAEDWSTSFAMFPLQARTDAALAALPLEIFNAASTT